MASPAKPLITIVTCVYNGEKYLEKLISSIQAQAADDIEHVIIDDGSTDNTLQIVNKYPSIHCWSRENRGLYASINEGIERASGEYICIIHSDDLLAPHALETVRDKLLDNGFPDGLYGKILYMDESEQPMGVQNMVNRGGLWVYKYFHHISHCSFYIKKEFLSANRVSFDPGLRYASDYGWFIDILQAKPRLVYINRFLSCFRVHENQASSQFATAASVEQKGLHQKYGVNETLFSAITRFTTLRNGVVRLSADWRKNGWSAIGRRIKAFIHRKRQAKAV